MIFGPSFGSKRMTKSLPVIVCPARSDSSGMRLLRKPSGPTSQASGSRSFLIWSRMGAANVPMNEPRSSLMLARAKLGASITKPSPVERSEEHTSELQSQSNLVCRLLLEKKKNTNTTKCQRSQAGSCGRGLIYCVASVIFRLSCTPHLSTYSQLRGFCQVVDHGVLWIHWQ